MDATTVTVWWQLGVMGIMLLFGISSVIGWMKNKNRE